MTRKIVATEYVTLDGFLDEPGVWAGPFWSDEAGEFKRAELFGVEAMLLGRRTYEGFAAAWPTMTDSAGFADRMNSMPKYVASRTLTEPTWNATVLRGDVVDAVTELKRGEGGDILLAGSGQLLDTLAQHDLVDEYRLMIHPIVLGEGTLRLFGAAPRRALELVGTTSLAKGVVVNTYRRTA